MPSKVVLVVAVVIITVPGNRMTGQFRVRPGKGEKSWGTWLAFVEPVVECRPERKENASDYGEKQ